MGGVIEGAIEGAAEERAMRRYTVVTPARM
jgi:hypothetical protein